jgi:hypothetical protein
MDVILLQSITGLGTKGQHVRVTIPRGEYLIAAGLAYTSATAANMSRGNVALRPDGSVAITTNAGTTTNYTADTVLGLFTDAATVAAVTATQTRMAEAMAGDMVLDISPATVDRATTAAAWSRDVTITLQNAAGDVHDWYTADLTVAIADTSGAGTASVVDLTPAMVNGVCVVAVSGDAALWDVGETDTLTVSDQTIMGYVVAGGTSVQTFIA